MRFRLHGGNLRVHQCPEHPRGCDFFDHAVDWMLGNRDDARAQLAVYRRSVVAHITAWTMVLSSIDAMINRLEMIHL